MRYIYLHGFASSPQSRKAQAFRSAFNEAGLALEVPALDEGDFAHLTISRQCSLLANLLRGDAATLIGSSMGGYLAALYAEQHPEIDRLVLLAPAFGFAPRWSHMTGPEKLQNWKDTGWMEVFHYGDRNLKRIHYGLFADALAFPGSPNFPQPALIFHGVADNVVPVDLSRAFAAAHPNAHLIELPSDHELTDVVDRILTQCLPFVSGYLPEAIPSTAKLTPDGR